jgi:hypothetical protein
LLTLAVVNKSASVVGGRNNNAPPSASRNVSGYGKKSSRMKRFVLWILFFVYSFSSFGQKSKDSINLTSLTKLDIGFQGLGLTFERRLSDKIAIDLSFGAGGGYDVSEDGVGFEWNVLQPAFYLAVTPKYFYNRQRRLEKGKKTNFNSGNYVGLRLKYTTPSVASNDLLGSALLMNLHWGLQRAIGKRWTINTHVGGGYAQDLSSQFGTIYPSIDLKFSYILSKIRK